MKLSEVSTPRLYHLSPSNKLTKLTPKVPDKLLVRTNAFEDTDVKRVSFASSIKGCLLGVQISESDFEKTDTITLFIYEPKDYNHKWKSNKAIVKERLVFDAKVTDEWWGLEPIDIKLIGEVRVYNNIIKTIEYTPIRVGDEKFLKPNGKLDTYLFQHDITWYSLLCLDYTV